MVKIDLIKEDLKKNLKKSRYEHSLSVANTAKKLARIYGVDEDKAYVAGLVHDCAKYANGEEYAAKLYNVDLPKRFKSNSKLIHTYVGPIKAKVDYKIEDEEILNAITSHTTGRIPMTMLDMIIFIADYIEPGRRQAPGLPEVRRLAFASLDDCLYRILKDTLDYLGASKMEIDMSTQQTYDYYKALRCDQKGRESL